MTIRRIAASLFLAGVTTVASTAGSAAVVAVDIGIAPPPPRVVAPPPPRPGWVWVDGYWRWNGHRHVWVDGRWIHARHGYRYIPPHWVQVGPRWHFVPGGWVR